MRRKYSTPIPNGRWSSLNPNSAGDRGSDITKSIVMVPSEPSARAGIVRRCTPAHVVGVHIHEPISMPPVRHTTLSVQWLLGMKERYFRSALRGKSWPEPIANFRDACLAMDQVPHS